MITDSLDDDWLIAWHDELDQALRPFLDGFEATYGYPPDANAIGSAEGDKHLSLPDPLAGFYRVIHEVSLPDIGNGYFIHCACHVHDELVTQGPVDLPGPASGTVFASDGGGVLYAITGSGEVHRSRAASRDEDFAPIAEDLTDFLRQLRHAVLTFIRTGEPGKL
ncbi:hypothetical protein HII36_08610 [Nonomuraea sp. NN258]|uniref:hypothetical protein n=1 Tax=Nonomuraea antri TaxID=2730852 RepID=UPI00156A0729|nr:hypothetical protein [Nonomuraea antri]NRQ31900.1 hypothetical protein [Nonomuraea antri]